MNGDYNAQLNSYKSQLTEQQDTIDLEKLKSEKIQTSIDINQKEIATLNDIMSKKTYSEQQLEAYKTILDNAKVEADKFLTTYKAGVSSQVDYLDKKNIADQAQGQYDVQVKVVEKEKLDNNEKLNQLNENNDSLAGDLKVQNGQVDVAIAELGKIQDSIKNLNTNQNKQYYTMLVDIEGKIVSSQGDLGKEGKDLEYSTLKSSVSGTINGLTLNTVGGVAKPADSIMTIIPDGVELVAECMVLNQDIGFVKNNQKVVVKVDTYPFQKFGTATGKVVSISPNSFKDDKMGYVYKVKVKLDKDYLESGGEKYPITSGMQVRAEIVTGKRRVIEFFLEPIIKYFDESLKVR